MGKRHYVKILPEHFIPVVHGLKRAELRRNDRDYKAGDEIQLDECNADYTGNHCLKIICHVADVGDYLEGYVLLSLIDWFPGYGDKDKETN